MVNLETSGKAMHLPLQVMTWSGGLLFVLIITYGVFLAYFDTAPPFTSTYVKTATIDGVETKVFRPGDLMMVRRDLCFSRNTPVVMGRTLNRIAPGPEPINVNINTTAQTLKKGCVSNANLVRIPDYAPPGTYEYRVTVQWSNNFMHDGSEILPMPLIEIVK